MICSWMVGVFFFSILVGKMSQDDCSYSFIGIRTKIGNIRDILGTAMKNKNEFRARQSAINSYMNKYKVVRLFFFAPTIESLIYVPGSQTCSGQSQVMDGVLLGAGEKYGRTKVTVIFTGKDEN